MKIDKKIFAEYHNPRYTREMDGELGNWSYANESKNSRAAVRRYHYNADLLDASGRHQIAAVNYPVVGMQSQNDPDYIEYQILLAKLAYIDGFMSDFRHLADQAGVKQLKLLKRAAERYDFEIGVDWCDAQIFYSLKKDRPDLDTREKQIGFCKSCFKYLLEEIYDGPTGANIGGHPVILLFGDGFTFAEFAALKRETSGFGTREPWYFRRAVMNGKYDGGTVTYTYDGDHEYFAPAHRNEIAGPFGWIPFRLRDAEADGKPYWDVYATEEDCLAYLYTLRNHAAENRTSYRAWISVVTPGMDQRGCAAWGRAISYLERGDGSLYRAMWKDNVKHREEADAVFIAGWNDYNEGHEIEPTLENGYRELETTAQYGAQFKGIAQETRPEDLRLPARLFALRKRAAKLRQIGCEVHEAERYLDAAAQLTAHRRCDAAAKKLQWAEALLGEQWREIRTKELQAETLRPVFRSAVQNIARQAEVWASSARPFCEAWRAADGEQLRSYWQSDAGPSELRLEWPAPHRMTGVQIFTGWLERADFPNWPMIPRQLTVECRTGDSWLPLFRTEDNACQDIMLTCDVKADALRIRSRDPLGMVIRGAAVLAPEPAGDGVSCYDGAGFQLPEAAAAQLRGQVFGGYLKFQYLDEGLGTFSIRSGGRFPEVCRITMDDTGAWKDARIRIYPAGTNWSHSMERQADLIVTGDVRIRKMTAEFTIYGK